MGSHHGFSSMELLFNRAADKTVGGGAVSWTFHVEQRSSDYHAHQKLLWDIWFFCCVWLLFCETCFSFYSCRSHPPHHLSLCQIQSLCQFSLPPEHNNITFRSRKDVKLWTTTWWWCSGCSGTPSPARASGGRSRQPGTCPSFAFVLENKIISVYKLEAQWRLFVRMNLIGDHVKHNL